MKSKNENSKEETKSFLEKGSALFNLSYSTLSAISKGSAISYKEMFQAQKERYNNFVLFQKVFHKNNKKVLNDRKQYWCTQLFYTIQLILNNQAAFQEMTKTDFTFSFDNTEAISKILQRILCSFDDLENVKKLLEILNSNKLPLTSDNQIISTMPLKDGKFQIRDLHIHQGDVIELLKTLRHQGFIPIVDTAPNSQRDGAAKYSSGSLEELLARYTDQALKMALHFCNVHQQNVQNGFSAFPQENLPEIDVLDYQKRYFQLIFYILSKVVEKGEQYLESHEFSDDLTNSYPNTSLKAPDTLPIYFGMQNNAYEVPVESGFIGYHSFADTKSFLSVKKVLETLFSKPIPHPVITVSYAAPDQRKLETSPLDGRSTSNKVLQTPSQKGTLEKMIRSGVAFHCQQAITLADKHPIAIVLLMPGCGAFDNPPQETASYFISELKKFLPKIKELNIPCYIVEYNPDLFNILVSTCKKEITNIPLVISEGHSKIPEKTFLLQDGNTLKITLKDLSVDNIEYLKVIPENLSVFTKYSLGKRIVSALTSPIHSSGNIITVTTPKKVDQNSQTTLELSYSEALTQAYKKNVEEVHIILMGSGKQGFTASESLQALLTAINKVRLNLPSIVLHIKKNKIEDYQVCLTLLEQYSNKEQVVCK